MKSSKSLPFLCGSLRLLCGLCVSLSPVASSAAKPSRDAGSRLPNVILYMADDMGMGDTSAYRDFTGNSDTDQLHTPNMERLARMGIRFTDAHTPASRCSPTRYGLLTGRYPWRNRLKYWVLYGSQGDPMIEPGRPTLATLFRDAGYGTAMVGKWHVGLRYRRSDGSPAAGWDDADLTQPLHTTPLDHGFDFVRFTSRSHGTSGPDAGKTAPVKKEKEKGKNKDKSKGKRNSPTQTVGPGHIHGRAAIGATGNGKELVAEGPKAYVLTKLGSRHSDHAVGWLDDHLAGAEKKPFFLYYPANANHSPYTPDVEIGGNPVAGASRTVSGDPMDARHDLVYENDVALGRLIDYLETTDDPRAPGDKLIENTIVIFTSDNGAEKDSDIATGPFRSNKGSCYEGGHRVPFIVGWPQGGIGDGDDATPGATSTAVVGLTDLFATFAEIIDSPLPELRSGEKGAEDSASILSAWRGEPLTHRPPLFFHDHKEMKSDPAVAAMRLDSPTVDGKTFNGQWKLFFDAKLLRAGEANPIELYDLATDQWEKENRIDDADLKPLIDHLTAIALKHRNTGGHRHAAIAPENRVTFGFQKLKPTSPKVRMTLKAARGTSVLGNDVFRTNQRGLGIGSDAGKFEQVDAGEAILISFDRDVLVESAAVVAGNGQCGGFYTVGDHKPLAIYCIDAANDAKDQSGILSDIGVLKSGETLRLDSSPHYGSEPEGRWRLGAITVRVLED